MSIFMTWDKKPFFAGTYFPPEARYGQPGFPGLLAGIAKYWRENREELLESAEDVISHLKKKEDMSAKVSEGNRADLPVKALPGHNLIEQAVRQFEESFDSRWGGFGQAPKFPAPHNLIFLALYAGTGSGSDRKKHALEMVEKTLMQMRKGGIFDQIGYGFSRYSTDRFFLIPHFEKMLYDNALLIMAYTAAYGVTGKPFYLDVAEETARYIIREMTDPEGGFYSAQDADSGGVEGRFYTFTPDEIRKVLGEERGRHFARVFDITSEGNFEGTNIPNLLKSGDCPRDFEADLQLLYDYRKKRGALHLDDKILLSWNGLMTAALSMLYRACGKERYLQAALRAADFLERHLCDGARCAGSGGGTAAGDNAGHKWKAGRLSTSYRAGKRSDHCVLDDYAFWIWALIELNQATLDEKWLDKAEAFCGEAQRLFQDRENGGFFLSPAESGELFLNPRETYDGALPSGNSVMAYNLARLYRLTGREVYREAEERQRGYLLAKARDYPAGHGMFLLAELLREHPPVHITVALKEEKERVSAAAQLPLLADLSLGRESDGYPLLNGETTYYVCRDHVCLPPANRI